MVGISGGVDSAVAALLLKQKGYDVEGLFMRNWDSNINNDILGNPNSNLNICPQEQDYNDALELCSINKNYTIIPNLILKNNIYTEIKEKVEPGNIISLEINDSVIKELPVVINYLKSKDFTITNLETHLSEELNTF